MRQTHRRGALNLFEGSLSVLTRGNRRCPNRCRVRAQEARSYIACRDDKATSRSAKPTRSGWAVLTVQVSGRTAPQCGSLRRPGAIQLGRPAPAQGRPALCGSTTNNHAHKQGGLKGGIGWGHDLGQAGCKPDKAGGGERRRKEQQIWGEVRRKTGRKDRLEKRCA